MARLPGIDSVVSGVSSLMQAQADALAALPGTVASLTAAVRGLADTVQRTNTMLVRLDGIVAELEQPLKDLAPGLSKLAVILDDPVIEDLPDTLRQVQADILPVLRTLADTHERVAFIAGQTERIMTFVDETSRTLAHLPGAALLGRRTRPRGAVVVEGTVVSPADEVF